MIKIGFIGSTGIPNKYGGFESFLEHCTPVMVSLGAKVCVTCDARLYKKDRMPLYKDVERIFIPIPANGFFSIIHDLYAFFAILTRCKYIIVLGVSGGIWFPLFKLICAVTRKRLLVNVDGVEWRRNKHGVSRKYFLKMSDWFSQRFSDVVIYDNASLKDFLIHSAHEKSVCIAYSGDHSIDSKIQFSEQEFCLTICRIEPENNIEMLIEGFLLSGGKKYIFVGNWSNSRYGRLLKAKYGVMERIELLEPIYDLERITKLRSECLHYLHGHSVGGTNPSLVEILFYNCRIHCLDVSFNRSTCGNSVSYFSDEHTLADAINGGLGGSLVDRENLRSSYTSKHIAQSYLRAAVYRKY